MFDEFLKRRNELREALEAQGKHYQSDMDTVVNFKADQIILGTSAVNL